MNRYYYFMDGVLFSKDESGEMIQCGMCGREDAEGFSLESSNEAEFEFLELQFGDVSNWTVNLCCQEKFSEICSVRGFELRLKAGLPLKTVFAY